MATRKPKEERQAEILDAAIRCFAAKGYHETSMDDIVRESGLSKGALYWHFKNKKELFRSLLEQWFAGYESGYAELSEAGSATEKLRQIMKMLEDSVAVRPELVRAQLEFYALAVREETYRDWLRESFAGQMVLLEDLFREGVANGEFRDLPVERVVRMFAAYLDGAMLQQELYADTDGPGGVLNECLDTFLLLVRKESHD